MISSWVPLGMGIWGSIRGKKWYWCLITRVLDMAIVNSHILHKTAVTGDEQQTLLNCRREIAVTYLKAARQPSRGAAVLVLSQATPQPACGTTE